MRSYKIRKIYVLLLLIILLSLIGCTNNKIRLDIDNSHLLSDFAVENGKVFFSCGLAVENLTNADLTVKITAYSQEDVDGGLLKQANMAGYGQDMTSDTFTVAKGENNVVVIVVGDFAGKAVKHDRLIPDDIRFEIIDNVV